MQTYHDEGHGFVECSGRFGFTKSAWNKAIARCKLRMTDRQRNDRRRRYNWAEVQSYYDMGASVRECKVRFGFHAGAWGKAVRRGEIKPRPNGMPLEQLLRSGKSRHNIKNRLIRAGLLRNRCDQCGISEWRGKPLIAHIDHINGIRYDHRLENLRMLCPNCHSQTDSWGGRNRGRLRLVDDGEEAGERATPRRARVRTAR